MNSFDLPPLTKLSAAIFKLSPTSYVPFGTRPNFSIPHITF